jgi:hypothetical protein
MLVCHWITAPTSEANSSAAGFTSNINWVAWINITQLILAVSSSQTACSVVQLLTVTTVNAHCCNSWESLSGGWWRDFVSGGEEHVLIWERRVTHAFAEAVREVCSTVMVQHLSVLLAVVARDAVDDSYNFLHS